MGGGDLRPPPSAFLAAHWPDILSAQEHAHRAAASNTPPKLEFLTAAQAAEIEGIASQIIPTDETPGAREAGVIYFIDRALTTFDQEKRPVYIEGLKETEAKLKELFPQARRMADLKAEQQIELLKAIEKSAFFDSRNRSMASRGQTETRSASASSAASGASGDSVRSP